MDIIQNQVIPNMQQAAITNINNTTNNTTNNNTTNNNTNNFNLNIFLNETCKDAINMTEFIENLKVGLILICMGIRLLLILHQKNAVMSIQIKLMRIRFLAGILV